MSVEMLPSGFRRATGSGLIVPEEHSRVREVLTWQEWRTIEKATAILSAHGVKMFLGCEKAECKSEPMTRFRRPDGGITLRCAHADREFHRTV